MYDAREVSNWFIGRSRSQGIDPTLIQVSRLCYIAHGWHLEMRGTRLFGNKIEAWRAGPMIPDVYHACRAEVPASCKLAPDFVATRFSSRYEEFLDVIHREYSGLKASRLLGISCENGSAWDRSLRLRGLFAIIKSADIRTEYIRRRERLERRKGPDMSGPS